MVEAQIGALRLAIREHPRHADLHYRLGMLLRHQERFDEAIKAF